MPRLKKAPDKPFTPAERVKWQTEQGPSTWEIVRAEFNYPGLKPPIFKDKVDGGAHFNFATAETVVGAEFVEQQSRCGGIPIDWALKGVEIHEVGHYMRFPRNLATLLTAAHLISSIFPSEKDKHDFTLQTFMDLGNDTLSALEERKAGPIFDMREANLRAEDLEAVDIAVRSLMLAYIYHQAERHSEHEHALERAGTVLKDPKAYFERMLKIDFNGCGEAFGRYEGERAALLPLRLAIHTFGTVIVDIFKELGKKGNDGDSGRTKPGTCDHNDCDLKQILSEVSPEKLKEALRKIAGNVSKEEFDRLSEWLKEKMKEAGLMDDPGADLNPAGVRTIGTSKGQLRIDKGVVEYCRNLSQNYAIPITTIRMPTRDLKEVRNDSKKWCPGDDPSQTQLLTSGGKFLPGVTRTTATRERRVFLHDYDIPYLLVAIDSSGSMPDPRLSKNYAVLGGFCAARTYHMRGARIGVINFSGDSFYLPYTRDLDSALGAIAAYQGGGTVIDVELVAKMLGPKAARLAQENPELLLGNPDIPDPSRFQRKEVRLTLEERIFAEGAIDFILFTDGGIWNLDELLRFLNEQAALHRVTLVNTHKLVELPDALKGGKIQVANVEDPRDIPKIVIKQVRDVLNRFAETWGRKL